MNLLIYWVVSFIMFMGSILVFIFNHKHLLSVLLSLEYMMLCLFFILFIYVSHMNYENYILMMFLVFSVCEGALGLSILVSLIRTHGNDYFQSFNIL